MEPKSILVIKYESEIPAACQALESNNIAYSRVSNNKFEINSDTTPIIKDIMKKYEINFEIL